MRIETIDHTRAAPARAIHQLLEESYRAEASLLGIRDFPPLRRTAAEVRTAATTFLGCWFDDDLVAVAEIQSPTGDEVEIASFVVAPHMFRKGIGTSLLERLVALHPDRTIIVSTAAANVPAISFYSNLHFATPRTWTTPEGVAMVALRRSPAR